MLTEKHDFNEIYAKYKNLVLKTAYLYSGDYNAAEDIMQEAFLRLYKEIDEKPHPNVKAWLCTAAKYLAINYKKKMDGKSAREISETEIKSLENTAGGNRRKSTEAECLELLKEEERRKLHESIFTCLMEKNPRWYEAVMLVFEMEYLQVNAAEKMNMSEEAFYVMLHRARKWIKKTYGVEYEELSRQ